MALSTTHGNWRIDNNIANDNGNDIDIDIDIDSASLSDEDDDDNVTLQDLLRPCREVLEENLVHRRLSLHAGVVEG